jgi:Glycosyl transferase family 90
MTAAVFELCGQDLSRIARDVLGSYTRAFASRGVHIVPAPSGSDRPFLFTTGAEVVDKARHCFWNWGDNAGLDDDGKGCGWVWHHGPSRELTAGADPRTVVLPRNDLFEIRGIGNSPEDWADYRASIATAWSDKRDEVYFRGHFTGAHTTQNTRVLACRLVEDAGLPADVGLLAETTPPAMVAHVTIRDPDPLATMGQYKYVLSLWGNHAFNPRLYRGLEAGSLVFHQATPTIRLVDDGLLVPGEHYVEVAPDLSDLVEKVEHFVRHPSEAHAIAEAGHRAWMETLFIAVPYTLSDVLWDRFTSQPNWKPFCDAFAVR